MAPDLRLDFESKCLFDATLDRSLTGRHFVLAEAQEDPLEALEGHYLEFEAHKVQRFYVREVSGSYLDNLVILRNAQHLRQGTPLFGSCKRVSTLPIFQKLLELGPLY